MEPEVVSKKFPLTPALSPSEGERENRRPRLCDRAFKIPIALSSNLISPVFISLLSFRFVGRSTFECLHSSSAQFLAQNDQGKVNFSARAGLAIKMQRRNEFLTADYADYADEN
ncbi:MAG: hypothetical protein C5B50_26010 [Verrucomicrobia bacterium]|nr:MAG: hypothetical protein C5B50_26010 [Verrucomicrobiota bacterium]